MKKTTFIYLIKLLDNKVYIGKTINIKHRESAHRKTFGSIIKLNIIDEIESLDREDWKPLEIKWIQYYKDLGYDVINKNKGGGGPEFVNDDTRKKIGNKNRCPKPDGFGGKLSLALKGRKFKTNYVCTEEHKEAIRKSNSKPNTEKTKQKISNSLLSNGGNKKISQKKKEWFENNKHPLIRQVVQINPISNKIIKIWNSRSELINNGYTGIQYALSKENHIYKNSLWKYNN